MAATPQFVGTARDTALKLVNASGNAVQTLLTFSAASLVEVLFVTSNDTTSRMLTLLKTNNNVDVLITTVTIPAATAARPVVQVNLMEPSEWTWLDPNNIKWVFGVGTSLKARMESPVSVGAEVAVILHYGEF